MEYNQELIQERAYTQRVQELLLAVIEQSTAYSDTNSESVRAIIADAWEELRLKPTALSQQELDQLQTDISHYLARKSFDEEQAERYRSMLLSPFFARVDFIEEDEDGPEKIVIGLYMLKDEAGEIMVHDWRAPISGLYYDALPGPASFESPSGEIAGTLTLKRQYRMENGHLKYFVDTSLSIDDETLLDILSQATSAHMRQIVSTIQQEQSQAIRHDPKASVISVVGGAGSGKTSIAMHRAAYLMYRQRDTLDAHRIQILSPGSAFSEYISTVLPELGEENIRARTLREILEEILGKKIEDRAQQVERLLQPENELRRQSVRFKGDEAFRDLLDKYAESFSTFGPAFGNVRLDGNLLIRREELRHMYAGESKLLTPAQRVMRIQGTLETRLAGWEDNLLKQYEKQYSSKYQGRELRTVCRLAVSQRLQSVRAQLKNILDVRGEALLREALKSAPKELKQAHYENVQAGLTWWEDAVAEAYLLLKLGFVRPDKSIYHLLVDEAQDYSETALSMLHLYFPSAKVTLLGDPKQRTLPGMRACHPEAWGPSFGDANTKVFHLSRCYRSTLPIARLCNAILPEGDQLEPFGREGEMPVVRAYSPEALKETLAAMRSAGHKTIAVITRTSAEAKKLAKSLENVYLLEGGEEDPLYEAGDTVVGSYYLVKGLEFDAVIVVWGDVPLTDDERRRLYTAASRALHSAALLMDEHLIQEMGIVL